MASTRQSSLPLPAPQTVPPVSLQGGRAVQFRVDEHSSHTIAIHMEIVEILLAKEKTRWEQQKRDVVRGLRELVEKPQGLLLLATDCTNTSAAIIAQVHTLGRFQLLQCLSSPNLLCLVHCHAVL